MDSKGVISRPRKSSFASFSKLVVYVICGAGALAAAIVYFVFFHRKPSPTHSLPMVVTRLETSFSGLLDVAEARGYFRDEGLAVTILRTQTGYQAISAVTEGRATVGTSAEAPIASALARGQKVKIIASIFTALRAKSGIVARRDHGVSQPGDLKGKRIAVLYGSSTHYMLETFLVYNDVPLDSVTLVPLKTDELAPALVSGEVDAASIWEPMSSAAQAKLGDKAIAFSAQGVYSEMNNLFVGDGHTPETRDKVVRYLRALAKAEDFTQTNAEEASRIIATASGVDPVEFRRQWNPLDYGLELSQSLLLATENEARWFLRRGMVTGGRVPDILDAFDAEYLRQVKPSAVGVVK